jgi:hypothetical protein
MLQQNFLSPTGFKFVIKRLPTVSFFVQTATVPGLSSGSTDIATPFKNIHFAGDKLLYNDFEITIRVDEKMVSFIEIYKWIIGLTKPESFDEYKQLLQSPDGLYSDATLTILDSKGNPSMDINFEHIFPVFLGDLRMDTTMDNISYISTRIIFRHNGYKLNPI